MEILKRTKGLSVSKHNSQIRWNLEEFNQDDKYLSDSFGIYHFFIKSRNPKKVLQRILEQFYEAEFFSGLVKEKEMSGHINNTVNDFLYVGYKVHRKIERVDFSWTDLPVIKDNKLSNYFTKSNGIERYLSKFIE